MTPTPESGPTAAEPPGESPGWRSIASGDIGVWLAGVALAVLLGILASIGKGWATPIAVIAVLGVGWYYTRVFGLHAGLVVLLILTTAIDRFTFQAGPVALRAEQVAAVTALAALVIRAVKDRRFGWLRPNAPEAFLLAWLVCNLVSSLLASPDRRLSAKILALLAVCALGFLLPRRLLASPVGEERLPVVVRWLLIAFATEASYGTITYLLHVIGPTISIAPNGATGYLTAYGTMWEANVFGGYAAAGIIAWAYLGPRKFRRAWLGIAACMGGLATSLTRAAWLAAIAVGALGVGLRVVRRRLDLPNLARGLIAGLVLAAATFTVDHFGKYNVPTDNASGQAGSGSGPRLANGILLSLLNRVDLIGRLNQFGVVWDDIRGHLLLGVGTATFESVHQVRGLAQHIASLPLFILDSTGLIGLALFMGFALAVVARAWTLRRNEIVLALGQVGLVVAITNLSTENTELMVGWFLIGLLMAAADVAERQRQPSAE